MATKKTTVKKRARKGGVKPKRDDLLRELLQFVLTAIDRAHPNTRAHKGIKALRNKLPGAIQKLKDNPGPVQDPSD